MRWDRILIITMIKVSKYGRWISDNGRIMSSRSRIFLVSGSDTRNRPPRPQKHCWILRKIQTCPHYLMNIWNTRVDEQVRGGADSVTCSAAPCVTLFIGKSTTKSFISCLGSWGEKKELSSCWGRKEEKRFPVVTLVEACCGARDERSPLLAASVRWGTKAATASSFGQTDGTRQRGGRPAN